LHTEDPGWYSSLTGHLDKDQQKEVQEIITMADQRRAVEGELTRPLSPLLSLCVVSPCCYVVYQCEKLQASSPIAVSLAP